MWASGAKKVRAPAGVVNASNTASRDAGTTTTLLIARCMPDEPRSELHRDTDSSTVAGRHLPSRGAALCFRVVGTRADSLRDLQRAPGVGPATAADLYELGLRSLDDAANADPEDLYERLCELTGTRVDRCVLYVFRCARYFASNAEHDPELLKWWDWKDR